MNKLVQALSALVALFSFSACSIETTPYYAATYETVHAVDMHQFDGYVRPTDLTGCVMLNPQKDPPLPKNVPNATWYSGGTPPAKYSKDTVVTLYFDNPNIINKTLANGKPACNATLFAYTYPPNGKKRAVMHLPNPCTYPQTDAYARLACHEMGHANGWPGYHGDY